MSLAATCVSLSTPSFPALHHMDTCLPPIPGVSIGRTQVPSSHMAAKPTVRTLDRTAILRTASIALRSDSVEIHRLDDHLYRSYRISDPSNDDTFCVLKCPPAPNTRLLRHEHDRLSTEAHCLQIFSRRKGLPIVQQPALLDHQTASFTLIGPQSGVILEDLETPLSPSRRRTLDRSLGQYLRRLNAITCPTFGQLQRPQHQSWARCFASMLLEVLRDAEDGLVSLPYSEVRAQLKRHWDRLDSVSEARLTITEVPADGAVFDERSGEVRGLIDYGSAMWADPMFSDCFVRASEGLVEGYGAADGEDQKVRRLLYIVYHSLVAIVRQCFRPGSSGSENEARRSLTTALQYLNAVDAS